MNGSSPSPRGTERLLRDCAALGRLASPDRPPARRRLERKLGKPLVELLLRSRA